MTNKDMIENNRQNFGAKMDLDTYKKKKKKNVVNFLFFFF